MCLNPLLTHLPVYLTVTIFLLDYLEIGVPSITT